MDFRAFHIVQLYPLIDRKFDFSDFQWLLLEKEWASLYTRAGATTFISISFFFGVAHEVPVHRLQRLPPQILQIRKHSVERLGGWSQAWHFPHSCRYRLLIVSPSWVHAVNTLQDLPTPQSDRITALQIPDSIEHQVHSLVHLSLKSRPAEPGSDIS